MTNKIGKTPNRITSPVSCHTSLCHEVTQPTIQQKQLHRTHHSRPNFGRFGHKFYYVSFKLGYLVRTVPERNFSPVVWRKVSKMMASFLVSIARTIRTEVVVFFIWCGAPPNLFAYSWGWKSLSDVVRERLVFHVFESISNSIDVGRKTPTGSCKAEKLHWNLLELSLCQSTLLVSKGRSCNGFE